MKLNPTTLAATCAILLAGAAGARADILLREAITVSGTIEQQTDVGKTTTPKKPITVARILAVLGISNQNAADLRYFYDSDTNAIVLAPKTVQSGDDVAPVATVIAFSDPTVSVTYGPNRSTQVNNVSLLNGGLPGIAYGSFVYTAPTEQRTYKVTAAAVLESVPTIVKLTVVERFKPAM